MAIFRQQDEDTYGFIPATRWTGIWLYSGYKMKRQMILFRLQDEEADGYIPATRWRGRWLYFDVQYCCSQVECWATVIGPGSCLDISTHWRCAARCMHVSMFYITWYTTAWYINTLYPHFAVSGVGCIVPVDGRLFPYTLSIKVCCHIPHVIYIGIILCDTIASIYMQSADWTFYL